jgi:hypothetical protein
VGAFELLSGKGCMLAGLEVKLALTCGDWAWLVRQSNCNQQTQMVAIVGLAK